MLPTRSRWRAAPTLSRAEPSSRLVPVRRCSTIPISSARISGSDMAYPRSKDRFTIGAGAGFAGDRIEPAVHMAASGEVDAIALECLAERTLVNALRVREGAPERDYDPRLVRRFTPLLPHLRNGCRVVTNLG